MICYKDKAYCASEVKEHTCSRELTEQERQEAIRLELPIAFGEFCNINKHD